ncbi:helix-turn-helix domain-containing protein [Mucilaginibacter sp.]|uniref:AraC family transcriptional regulator n=1 Tax=Mucilaginibacter sp. TaxID=1882438 RepID=UPI0035BC6E66
MPIDYLKKIHLGEFNETGYRISPSEAMASVIEGFYVFSPDTKPERQLVFNDGFPVLVFLSDYGDSINVSGQTNHKQIKAVWASAGSIKNVHVEYSAAARQIFVARFLPGTFYRLFGLNAQFFRHNPVAPFIPIARSNNFSVRDFFKCHDIESKITFIETYVSNSSAIKISPGLLHQTLNFILDKKGSSNVRNITDDAGVNYKWLERSFAKNIGLLPKEFIQLQRFFQAYLELVGDRNVDLMHIALANGYYDANHFSKDFKVYTGKSPIEYLRSQSPAFNS